MYRFEERLRSATGEDLRGTRLEVIQVNLGLRCNQQCGHCHLGASPSRTETMEWPVMDKVLEARRASRCPRVDLTGGAPELNPHFQEFVTVLRGEGAAVQLRTNLTVLLEPGMERVAGFLRDEGVDLVASMPCYLEENVTAQRGPGVYEKSIRALRRLNTLGYGTDGGPSLDLVYNPGGPFLPPRQADLEAAYRRELASRFGITFSRLLTITNMPIGRFGDSLRFQGQEQAYLDLLVEAFNPRTLEGLMCRRQVSVGWEGTLYDCDFNLALRLPVNHGAPARLQEFDAGLLASRRIVTGDHCFACTAGFGSSCGGALV
jgi:radical SAM/Cys-rich protein